VGKFKLKAVVKIKTGNQYLNILLEKNSCPKKPGKPINEKSWEA